jgi:hypothetical protein
MLVDDWVADCIYLMEDAVFFREEKEILFREIAFIWVGLKDGEFCALQIGFIE